MQPASSRVAVVANGEIISYDKTKRLLSTFEKVIAVDGGLDHCEKMKIIPYKIVGDLDSVSAQTLKKYPHVPLLKYPREKDESDLELAIDDLLNEDVDFITLFGVLGKRVDHLLYTLYLLTRHPTKLVIESEDETIFCLQGQKHIKAFPGQTVSLIPLNQVSGLTTEGLKWELHHATFDKKFMSLSNICLGNSFKVNVGSGDLLCCLQKQYDS